MVRLQERLHLASLALHTARAYLRLGMRLKVRYYICLLDLGTGPTSTIDAAASISAADISLAVRVRAKSEDGISSTHPHASKREEAGSDLDLTSAVTAHRRGVYSHSPCLRPPPFTPLSPPLLPRRPPSKRCLATSSLAPAPPPCL